MHHTNLPTQTLLFFVGQEFDEELEPEIEQLVEDLADSRPWSIHPPEFVNEADDDDIETLGGMLTVYNALPPNNLATELDRANLEEVKDLVRMLQTFSQERDIVFELELDQVSVGTIENGQMDESLRIGLLEEWERVLTEREATETGE